MTACIYPTMTACIKLQALGGTHPDPASDSSFQSALIAPPARGNQALVSVKLLPLHLDSVTPNICEDARLRDQTFWRRVYFRGTRECITLGDSFIGQWADWRNGEVIRSAIRCRQSVLARQSCFRRCPNLSLFQLRGRNILTECPGLPIELPETSAHDPVFGYGK
jgi:hypothetical protein